MKNCSKCKELKSLSFFYKSRTGSDGLTASCKKCTLEIQKQYRLNNKEKRKEYEKQYRLNNKERLKENTKQYWLDNKERLKENKKQYQLNNKERLKENKKLYLLNNKGKKREIDKIYRLNNKEKIKERKRLYNLNNKEKYTKTNELYRLNNKEKKREIDKLYRLNNKEKFKEYYRKNDLVRFKIKIRNYLKKGIKKNNFYKKDYIEKVLGCSLECLKKYLEDNFQKMYGIPVNEAKEILHIDHIIPLSTAKTEEEIIKLNNYTNLQYLYASHNLEKSDKLEYQLTLKM